MMDVQKTNEQHIGELTELRSRQADLEKIAEALNHDVQRFRDMVDLLPQIIFEMDERGYFTFTNAHIAQKYGYTREDLTRGIHGSDVVIPEDRARIRQEIDAVLKGGISDQGSETVTVTRDGQKIPTMLFSKAIFKDGKIVGLRGVGVDISKQKQAEMRLRESEERYRSIVANSHSGIAILDDQYLLVLVNPQVCQITGYTEAELLNQDVRKYIDEDHLPLAEERYIRRQRGEAVPDRYEILLRRKDGEKRLVELRISLFRDGQRQMTLAQLLDITEGRQSEETLQKSENLYRTIFDTTGTSTLIIDEDMTIRLVNKDSGKLTGYSRTEIEGRMKITDFLHPEDVAKTIEHHRIQLNNPANTATPFEVRAIHKDGSIKHIISITAMIPGTKSRVASIIDITERKQMEEALRSNERELVDNARRLEELNEALRALLKHKQDDQEDFERKILSNVRELVLPYLERLRELDLNITQSTFVEIIETNLNEIMSPFLRTLTSQYLNFTPKEIQVANYIKSGKKTKDIARVMGVTTSAVDLHRNHIRNKLGLNKKKVNLRTYLSTLV